MLEQTKLKFYRFLSVILLVALLSLSGVMYVSAHGGDVTLIHACVTNRSGAVRIVGATTSCEATRETALDWGIQGPKGDQGDTGNVGPIGSQGPQGDIGPMGPQGPAGVAAFYSWERVFSMTAGQRAYIITYCQPGDWVMSGGWSTNFGGKVTLFDDEPIYNSSTNSWGWQIDLSNDQVDQTIYTTAICADTTP